MMSVVPQDAGRRSAAFTEAGSERMLRDLLLLGAAFTGASMAVVLRDESGTWYRDSSGLPPEALDVLERGARSGADAPQASVQGFGDLLPFLLTDVHGQPTGTLWAVFPEGMSVPEPHRKGLALVAEQVQTLLVKDRGRRELRAVPRAPAAASFVPGLVHELRNFIFGITAHLDAFEARFSDQGDVGPYGTAIRRGLDRLIAFVSELKDYADPQPFVWRDRALEPLLQEAFAHLHPQAERNGVTLELTTDGALPRIRMDESSLRGALIHLIGLAIQYEGTGGCVRLGLALRRRGDLAVVCGRLSGVHVAVKDVDPARLFEPFYFRRAGLGRLALPAARRIFEAHGGHLGAQAGPEDSLTFDFMLPAAAGDPPPSTSGIRGDHGETEAACGG